MELVGSGRPFQREHALGTLRNVASNEDYEIKASIFELPGALNAVSALLMGQSTDKTLLELSCDLIGNLATIVAVEGALQPPT